MLKFLEEKDWTVEIVKERKLYLNEVSGVVKSIAKNFSLKPQYLIYELKRKPIISFIAFTKQKHIVKPVHFFYSAFWVDAKLSDNAYSKYVTLFLADLQSHFKSIDLNLPPTITDVRPFLWSHFKVENKFTYHKNLDSLIYAKDVQKNIRAIAGKEYVCLLENLSQPAIKLNLLLLKQLSFKQTQIKAIINLLNDLAAIGKVTCYNCYLFEELVASNILFLDEAYSIAYTILLNKRNSNNADDVHALLHNYFFSDLQKLGFEVVDLMGADMQNIAAFKSRFLTDLKPHFYANFSSAKRSINTTVSKAKNITKKVVRFFN